MTANSAFSASISALFAVDLFNRRGSEEGRRGRKEEKPIKELMK